MPFQRRDFTGGAVQTTLVGTVTALSVTWQIDDPTGWPLGTNGPFYAVFERGVPGREEKVLCASLSGSTVTLASPADRGVDGTTAQAHSTPATFEHCSSAVDVDEANLVVEQSIGQVQALGDVLTGKNANRLQRTAAGSNDALWICDDTQPGGMRFGSVPVGGINSTAQLADGIVTQAKISSDFYGPYCLSAATGQPVSTGINSLMVFTAVIDTGGMVTSTTRFTVPVDGDGIYGLSCGVPWADPGADPQTRRYVGIRLNGAVIVVEKSGPANSTPYGTTQNPSRDFPLSAGDYLEVLIRQDTAGTISVLAVPAGFFSATWLRPA